MGGEFVVFVFVAEAFEVAGLAEHFDGAGVVEVADFGDAEAEGERGGDDGASGSAADVIEVVAEAEIWIAGGVGLAKLVLEFGEDLEGDDATDAAAVEGEELFGGAGASLEEGGIGGILTLEGGRKE